jgi:hypothetical protein
VREVSLHYPRRTLRQSISRAVAETLLANLPEELVGSADERERVLPPRAESA